MYALTLHQIFVECDALHKELDPRNIVLACQVAEDFLKRFAVASAIVGWNPNSEHHNGRAGCFALQDNILEIVLHSACRNTPEAVITAELQNDQGRVECLQSLIDSCRTTLGCFTANAGVNHAMFVPLIFEPQLQQCRPGLVNVYTVTGAQAVTDDKDGWLLRVACADDEKQNKKGY